MEFDARHLQSDKLIKFYLSLSILQGERLRIRHATPEIVNLLHQIAPIASAELKGVGLGADECYFTPQKIVKNVTINLQGSSCVPLLQTILPTILLSGQKVQLTLKNAGALPSPYYIKDVLLVHLSRYILVHAISITKDTVEISIQGKYLREEAPPYVLSDPQELVAIRGEVHASDSSLVELLRLHLKEFSVPVRLHEVSGENTFIHLNALFGNELGFDNDFPFIISTECVGHQTPQTIATQLKSFKEKIRMKVLEEMLIEDLLLMACLVRGSIPRQNTETDMLVEELQELSTIEKDDTHYLVR